MKTEFKNISELEPGDKLYLPWPSDQEKPEWHKLPEVVTVKRLEGRKIIIEESGGLCLEAVDQQEFQVVSSDPANLTKVCPNPHCDAVYHNCKKSDTRCKTCDQVLVKIDKNTFLSKYADSFYQYDYQTEKFLRKTEGIQTQLF